MSFKVSEQFEVGMKLGRPQSEFGNFTPMQLEGGNNQFDMNLTKVKTFFIVESIHQLIPTVTIQYKQTSPLFQENYPITTMEPFILTLGKDKEEEDLFSEHYYFSSTKNDTTEPSPGESQNLVLKGFYFPIKFLLSGKRAGYNKPISDIMSEFVDELGVSFDKFIDSTDRSDSWVQPGWDNMKFMKYLTHQAISSSSSFANYFTFFRPDNKFYFKTLNSLFDQDRKDDAISRFDYILGENTQDQKSKSGDDPVDSKESNSISRFEWENDAIKETASGLLGHQTTGFNWQDGDYTTVDRSMLDIPDHNFLTNRIFFNRDRTLQGYFSTGEENNYEGTIHNQKTVDGRNRQHIIDKNSNVSRLTITTRSNTPLSIGDLARINIFDPGTAGNRQKVLSGDWLVENRVRFVYGRGGFIQKYTLLRTGINEPSVAENEELNERFAETISQLNQSSDFGDLGGGGTALA